MRAAHSSSKTFVRSLPQINRAGNRDQAQPEALDPVTLDLVALGCSDGFGHLLAVNKEARSKPCESIIASQVELWLVL